MVDAERFYDDLAADYHVLFEDWWTAAMRHGAIVGRLLAARGRVAGSRVLDCTCGVGTQALPLAALGYDVTGTDVSARAVQRARAEAERRGIEVRLDVADVRSVRDVVHGSFDAAISCDNSLPHLLTDEDLARALRSVRACLVTGATFFASIRDYDKLATVRPAGVPITLHGPAGARHGAGQAWSWSAEGDYVDITLFTLAEDADGGWLAGAHETTYRALRREVLGAALERNGFTDVHWLMPAESGYYQPMVVAVAQG